VIDSISRTINTDSLYRLWHTMLRASDITPVYAAIACETSRQGYEYGSVPAAWAQKRMQDTLWMPDERDAYRQLTEKISHLSPESIGASGVSPRKCGWGAMQDGTVDGTDLDIDPVRPAPPA
jgi:hypothetical protein